MKIRHASKLRAYKRAQARHSAAEAPAPEVQERRVTGHRSIFNDWMQDVARYGGTYPIGPSFTVPIVRRDAR